MKQDEKKAREKKKNSINIKLYFHEFNLNFLFKNVSNLLSNGKEEKNIEQLY